MARSQRRPSADVCDACGEEDEVAFGRPRGRELLVITYATALIAYMGHERLLRYRVRRAGLIPLDDHELLKEVAGAGCHCFRVFAKLAGQKLPRPRLLLPDRRPWRGGGRAIAEARSIR